jgi:hypothetical protein
MIQIKRFIEKAKFNKGTIIDAMPVHGEHSKPSKSKLIDKIPVHGAHSKPNKKLKEDNQHDSIYPVDSQGNEHIKDFTRRNYNDHIGNDTFEVHHAINLPHVEFSDNPQSHALKKYSSNSHDTNRELINNATGKRSTFAHRTYDTPQDKIHRDEQLKYHNDHVESLDKSFAHPNAVLKQDLHVFHGTSRFNPGEEAKKGGGRITFPAYTSTSIDPKIAADFAGNNSDSHIIHIHLKKGQRAHYLGTNSNYDHEKEVMLPRNSTVQINPIPTVVHNGYGEGKTHIWHGHVVDQPDPHAQNHDDSVHKDQMKFNF